MFWPGDLDHFAAFCETLELDNGRKLKLEPFQRTILADYFAGAKETLCLIPKKNGKTTLMAALLLYHLCYVDNAKAFLVASSIKQAGICYDFAVGFVERSPALQQRILVREGTRELRSRRDRGTAFVLAADADTADGVGATLAIIDELHRAKSTALYAVFRDGLDGREGAMLSISTAGDDEDGVLGTMRSNFLAMPGKRIRGRYTYCRSRDKTNVMHEWGLRPTDDLEDIDLVKSVNPLRSMTKGKLRRRRDSPTMTAGEWARFACNVWTQSDDAAIATLDWARKARQGVRLPDGELTDVVGGLDFGWTQDYTALVPVGHPHGNADEAIIDDRLVLIPAGTQAGPGRPVRSDRFDNLDNGAELRRLAAIRPGKVLEGRMTDEEVIKGALVRLWLIWPNMRWAADPNAGAQSILQWIERELADGDEDRVIVYSQQPAPMQAASMHFSAGIRAKVAQEPPDEAEGEDDVRTVPVFHPDHEVLNLMIRGASARWSGERWRFDKRRVPRSGGTRVLARPIDGVIGATLGYRALMAPRAEALEPFVFVDG